MTTRAPEANTIPKQSGRPIPGELDNSVLRRAIESARDGVSISDARLPEMPLIYVNRAFEKMTGYSSADVLGLNCRFLQGENTDQPELKKVRRALARGTDCIVTLQNFRRNGSLFHNELSMSAVHGPDGAVSHFIGIQKDVTRRIRAEQRLLERENDLQELNVQLERLARVDGLTELLNRRTFDQCLEREWRRIQRESGSISVYMIDVDHFKALNDRYGHAIGDSCLVRVARVIEQCFVRATDYVARYGGEEFIVLTSGMRKDEALVQGQRLLAAVRDCQLPTAVEKLTISIGLCVMQTSGDQSPAGLLKAADTALYVAKRAGRDRLELAPAE